MSGPLAERAAGAALSALAGEGPPAVQSATVVNGVCQLTVTIVPLADVRRPAVEYTACERAVLALVAEAAAPLTGRQVLAGLAAAGQDFGESTVVHALARLVRHGALRSSRSRPRGYTLALTH